MDFLIAEKINHRVMVHPPEADCFRGVKAKLAPSHVASQLTRCMMGAVPPISFDDRLQVVVDRDLLPTPEIVFSAGRLDVSIGVDTGIYLNAIRHQIGSISE
ncbi:hypothetical protein WK65_06305 [Burkholderia ubonensis]|nr:hypothetical protein WK65_06305 [Burkholderia ubonensis]